MIREEKSFTTENAESTEKRLTAKDAEDETEELLKVDCGTRILKKAERGMRNANLKKLTAER